MVLWWGGVNIRVLLTVLALVLLWSCSNFHFCRSVARCEALVKKQYSFLGWEYTEPDSEDDRNATGCGEVSSIKEEPPASLDANFSAIFTGVPSKSSMSFAFLPF